MKNNATADAPTQKEYTDKYIYTYVYNITVEKTSTGDEKIMSHQNFRNQANDKITAMEKVRKMDFNQEVKELKTEDDKQELIATYAGIFPSYFLDSDANRNGVCDKIQDCIDEEDDPRDALVLALEEDLEADQEALEDELNDDTTPDTGDEE